MSNVMYAIVAVIAIGIIGMAYHIGYSNGQKSERAEAQRVALEQIEKVRQEDQRRLDESERIANETKQKLQKASNDATSARSALSKLQSQLSSDRNKFGYPTIECASNSNRRTIVYANLLGQCGETVTELARIADQARIAGVACESQYNSLRE